MKMPKEIATHLKKVWLKVIRIKFRSLSFEDDYINDLDVENVENGVIQYPNDNPYTVLLSQVSREDGQLPFFWERIVKGEYYLFFETFPSQIKIEEEGETFMI